MSKKLYNELQEAFENLKKTEAEKVYAAVENHEFPPIPFTLPVVLNTVREVLEKHEVSKEELMDTLALNAQYLSAEDMQTITKVIEDYEE